MGLGPVRVNVTVQGNGNLRLATADNAAFTLARLGSSLGLEDLGFLKAGEVRRDSGPGGVIDAVVDYDLRGTLAAVRTDTLLSLLNNGRGVRSGQRPVDVLLVGANDGVFRAINPVGDPSNSASYPSAVPATIITGTRRRTSVSSSPAVKPKLPSPITETVFVRGRAKCAPTAAAIE